MKKSACFALVLLFTLLSACSLPALPTPASSAGSPASVPSAASSSPASIPASSAASAAQSPIATLEYEGKIIALGMSKEGVDAILGENGALDEEDDDFVLPGLQTYFYLGRDDDALRLGFAGDKLIFASMEKKGIKTHNGLMIGSTVEEFTAAYPEAATPPKKDAEFAVFFKDGKVVLASGEPNIKKIINLHFDYFILYEFNDFSKIESIFLTTSDVF